MTTYATHLSRVVFPCVPTAKRSSFTVLFRSLMTRLSAASPHHTALTLIQWVKQQDMLTHSPTNSPSSSPSTLAFGLKLSATGQWSVVASRALKRDSVVLRLPLLCTLAADVSESVKEKQQLPDLTPLLVQIPDDCWELKLGLRLLSERSKCEHIFNTTTITTTTTTAINDTSFFTPYLAALPATFPALPCFYTYDEVAALQYNPLIQQIKRRSQLMQQLTQHINASETLRNELFNGWQVTLSAVAWSMCAASSRAFHIVNQRRSLPLIDLINHHSHNSNVAVSVEDTSYVRLRTTRDVDAGEELSLNYGQHSNDAFLINYGFVEDANVNDSVVVKYELNNLLLACEMSSAQVNPEMSARKRLLIAESRIVSFTLTAQSIDPLLIAVIRLLTCKEDDVRLTVTKTLHDDQWTEIQLRTSSIEEETALLSSLRCFLELLLTSFPTTVEQDLQELTDSLQHPKQQHNEPVQLDFAPLELAIRYRLGKKRLINEHINRLKQQQQDKHCDTKTIQQQAGR